jgi:hypothetical protein
VPASPAHRTPFILAGALPRAGNHLLRGLLDNHPELLLPPDEDYFFRHLLRSPLARLRGALCGPERAPDFYRGLQKDGHLERVNAGQSKNASGTQDLLDLQRYYAHVRSHHARFSLAGMIRTHVGALEAALGVEGQGRTPVLFCAVQASKRDVLRQGRSLAALYDLRAVFVLRDPRAHYASKLGRKPGFDLKRFCRLQNAYARQVDAFERYAPILKVRFEDLVSDTAATMRRVCSFLEIAYSDAAATFTLHGEATRSNSSYGTSTGIDTSTLTRYRDTLPADVRGYIEAHCTRELFWEGSPASRGNDRL